MRLPGQRAPWRERLATGLTWMLVLATMGFMWVSCFWLSGFPRAALLSMFGETATAQIASSKVVQYASFPYDGTVHTVVFQTSQGATHTFELTDDPVPASLANAFEVSYLPAWPAIVQPVAVSHLSWVFLLGGILCTLVNVLFFGLIPHDPEHNLLLRMARRPGAALIAWLERTFESPRAGEPWTE